MSNLAIEKEIQQKIITHIDDFRSFIFNAGAGAGKTYALIESIKHILKQKSKELSERSQKIACITYTNVAANEIRKRLGETDIVVISTIHDRLWDTIKSFQNELVCIHRDKLESEIGIIDQKLSGDSEPRFAFFTSLSNDEKSEFIEFCEKTREIFYKHLSENSTPFKAHYNALNDADKPNFLSGCLKNVSNFKTVVKAIYTKKKYEAALEKIANGNVSHIKYNSNSNSDNLAHMSFSHDTLLDYSLSIVEKYPKLRRIIIDKFPYFFIDEFQDTNEKVVNIIRSLFEYARDHDKQWVSGYFGDVAQNIYDDGVGSEIFNLHYQINSIEKIFNRRSHTQVIEVSNRIRNDDIEQLPINESLNEGQVVFYKASSMSDEDEKKKVSELFLTQYQNDVSSQKNKQVHCLVLTNKLMTELTGFSDIYSAFNDAENIYFADLNTLLLSNSHEKLHPCIRLIYKLASFYFRLLSHKTTYTDIFGSSGSAISFYEAKSILDEFRDISATSIGEFISKLSNIIYTRKDKPSTQQSIEHILGISQKEMNDYGTLDLLVKSKIQDLMEKSNANNSINDKEEMESDKVSRVLDISMNQWKLWMDFIDKNDEERDIVFHTYHGTKGEEYENVAIIMGHDFGARKRNKFKNYFEHIQLTSDEQESRLSDAKHKTEFNNTRNLIYVACSRAIKNLRILYLDDITPIADGITSIFGGIEEFQLSE